MPTDPEKIYDLDNIVCMSDSESNVNLNKLIIGFISDVVGPVSMPLYCVSFYKNFSTVLTENQVQKEDVKDFIKDHNVCIVKKSLKLINAELPSIMNKKGCDASNIYDEELSDKEFSDDDAERAHKKQKKQKKLGVKRQ